MSDDKVGVGALDDGIGPVRPSPDVRTEVVDHLRNDSTRLGDVFRGRWDRELNAEDLAAELEVPTSGFVWNYSRTIRALIDGDLAIAPTLANGAARTFRRFLREKAWTPAAHTYLERNLAELEHRANDETARTVEVEQAKVLTERAESQNTTGIYVYALPHYLRHPYDARSGRTLMKVGHSGSDIIKRFSNQTRTTALPEEPILLRIYVTAPGDSTKVEAQFHRLLQAADHYQSVTKTAGREWFVTSIRFLDEVARTLSLPVKVVNDAEVTDAD